jgi:hypothetical protein
MRPTTILSLTSASALYLRVFAGRGEPLLEGAGSRRYLRESVPGCLSPYPGGIRGARARFFPRIIGLPRGPRTGRLNHKRLRSATSERRGFSGWLSAIPLRSGLQVCLPPGLLPPLQPALATGQL